MSTPFTLSELTGVINRRFFLMPEDGEYDTFYIVLNQFQQLYKLFSFTVFALIKD